MGTLEPQPQLDFSKYLPGDVLILDERTVVDLGILIENLGHELGRRAYEAGLGWSIEYDWQRCEYRITFTHNERDNETPDLFSHCGTDAHVGC